MPDNDTAAPIELRSEFASVEVSVDDDGNVGVLFFGISCAATTSDIIAEVLSSGGPTYVGSYTVLPPQPTI